MSHNINNDEIVIIPTIYDSDDTYSAITSHTFHDPAEERFVALEKKADEMKFQLDVLLYRMNRIEDGLSCSQEEAVNAVKAKRLLTDEKNI
jgi:hypothetical protein